MHLLKVSSFPGPWSLWISGNNCFNFRKIAQIDIGVTGYLRMPVPVNGHYMTIFFLLSQDTMNYPKKNRFQSARIAALCLYNIQRENLVYKKSLSIIKKIIKSISLRFPRKKTLNKYYGLKKLTDHLNNDQDQDTSIL